MTINEAIICLSIQLEVKHRQGKDFEANALQLGIEALKRCRVIKQESVLKPFTLLPGETPE